jgi:hypothetical protein
MHLRREIDAQPGSEHAQLERTGPCQCKKLGYAYKGNLMIIKQTLAS